jgi:cytosine/adenosine deaminase-related metal-dependent hydrolase
LDIGESLLMPGLINAHCHLDYTNMAGQIAPPVSFSDWIKALLAIKAHWTYSDFALSWVKGARSLLAHGTTTVVDIEAVPEMLGEVRPATPLRLCSLLEMTGVRSRRPAQEILAEAVDWINRLPAETAWAGLSPHAPYSTTPQLLQLSAELARKRHWLRAVHVAESREEFDMFCRAAGPMYDWLKAQRDMSDCGQGSPVQHLERQKALDAALLAVHVNYLAKGDAELLAERGASVVHCPRSHEYFGHDPFPRKEFVTTGVNVCVGTDSLASVRLGRQEKAELDLLSELRVLAKSTPELSPKELIDMVTINPGKALGKAGELGRISEGALADLIAIPFSGSFREASASVIAHTGPVLGTMIDGKWVVEPPQS